jgi:hypothetical protein
VNDVNGTVVRYVANLVEQTDVVYPPDLHTECDFLTSECDILTKKFMRDVCAYGIDSFTLKNGRTYQCQSFERFSPMFDFVVLLLLSPVIGIGMGVTSMFLNRDIFESKTPQLGCSRKTAVRVYLAIWFLGSFYLCFLVSTYAVRYRVPYSVAHQTQ